MANNIQVFRHLLRIIAQAGLQNAQDFMANPAALINAIIQYAHNNPWRFTLICAGIGLGIASFALPPLLGFAAAGPVLGSLAAGWQASIGVVAAGSAFAAIQSMAMTGAFTAIGGTSRSRRAPKADIDDKLEGDVGQGVGWDRMDAWRDGAVRGYELEKFDVKIVLVRPKKERGEEGFCEKFTDHETDCHRESLCAGDLDDL